MDEVAEAETSFNIYSEERKEDTKKIFETFASSNSNPVPWTALEEPERIEEPLLQVRRCTFPPTLLP
jgi:hypothetical protein